MHRARLPIAASFLLALLACETPTQVPQHVTDQLPGRGLEAVQPADVAVAPVRDESGGGAPVDAVRQACYVGLVDRLYSPVSLDYVDQQWTDASFGGGGAAEAVLEVAITKWDTTHVPQRGVVIARAEGRLIDTREPDGEPLWARGVTRRLDLGGPDPRGDWAARAGELLAAELLAELPQRDPIRANQ
jgi:hypothetical protein